MVLYNFTITEKHKQQDIYVRVYVCCILQRFKLFELTFKNRKIPFISNFISFFLRALNVNIVRKFFNGLKVAENSIHFLSPTSLYAHISSSSFTLVVNVRVFVCEYCV